MTSPQLILTTLLEALPEEALLLQTRPQLLKHRLTEDTHRTLTMDHPNQVVSRASRTHDNLLIKKQGAILLTIMLEPATSTSSITFKPKTTG